MTESEIEIGEEAIHEELHGWLFITDYTIYILTGICNMLLSILWIHYAYFKYSKMKTTQPPESPISNDISQTHIERQMMSTVRRHSIPFLGRLYMSLSVIFAMIVSFFYISFFTLRVTKHLTVDIINNMCSIAMVGMIPYAFNRLFLYLYLIWRIDISFNNSMLEISKKRLKFLSVTNSTIFMISMVFVVVYSELFGCRENSIFHFIVAVAPFILSDSIFAWLCLYLFVSRLRKLIKIDTDSNIINDAEGLQYIANKFTILSVVAVCFTMIISFIYLFVPLSSMSCIDTSLNVICLILSTKDYDLYYKKYCILCRNCCEKKYESKDQSKRVKSTSNLEIEIH